MILFHRSDYTKIHFENSQKSGTIATELAPGSERIRIKNNSDKNKAVNDEKAEARELWFKTVVKVISWKEGPKGQRLQTLQKINNTEWVNYCKETFKINASAQKSITQKKLDDIEAQIRKHGGFD